MDEIWERAVDTALDGQTDNAAARTLTLDGAVKCVHGRLPPPSLLEKFENLQHLSVANIGVSTLEQFPRLRNLQKLILSDNRIAGGLEFLVEAGLDSLRDLDLSNNRIQYIEDLAPLAQLKLISLDLYECPVTRVKDYRSRVFGLIKSLKYLDKMDAEENERPESDEEEDEEEDEEDDPGSGEIDGEERPYRLNNGHNEGAEGIVDVDEDEESDADEEETETSRRINGPNQNGFRVAAVEERDGGDEEEEGDEEENESGEEIDEEGDEDDDVVEVHEIDDSEDEEDGVEDEDDDDEDDDDDEEDEEEEVDNDEAEFAEPESTGRLTSTEGEIDGHDQGEDEVEEDDNGETGEEEQGVDDDGEFDDEEEGEEEDEEDSGAGYLVQPVGQAEVHDAGGSDMELGNEEDDHEGEEEVEDDDEVQVLPSSSLSHHKRKRDEDLDLDEDDDEDEEDDDVVFFGAKKQRSEAYISSSSSSTPSRRKRETQCVHVEQHRLFSDLKETERGGREKEIEIERQGERMSGKGGGGAASCNSNNNGKGNSGISGIPAGSRKIVQSLTEIVNCSESEIYAMLKECNMDPNEAVNRLLSQDPFHEVKSKREKKKENKETTDVRSRGANNTMHRGGRGGADRYGRGGSTQFSSNETGVPHAKPSYKKENGTHAYAGSSSSASGMAGNTVYRRPQALHSDSLASENRTPNVDVGDGLSQSLQPPSGFQSSWLGGPGQVSMADIVKMGRPHNKASAMPPHHGVNLHHPAAPSLAASNHDLHLSENHTAKISEINAEQEVTASQCVHSNDEWPSTEQPTASSISSVLEVPADTELYADPADLPLDRISQHMKSQLDDVLPAEDGHAETLNGNHGGPASVSSRNMQEDNSVGSSIFDNNLYGNVSSYQPPGHAYEHEAEDVASSVAANLQQLNLHSDDQVAPPEEDNASVIIPNHLQVHGQDFSHLSFGSFGSGISSAFSGPFASRPSNNNQEETTEVVDTSSAAHPDPRNPEYYGDEHLRNTADENLIHRTGASPVHYDSPSVPQPEVLNETPEAAQVNQYAFPSSAPGYTYDNAQQLNAAFNNPQTSSQIQNVAPFSSVMAYTNSLPSTLLASTIQPGREPDLPYSPFPVTQSMPTKYSNTASPINGPSISVPEALRSASISTPQPTQQTLPGASVATGPTLPQHLAVHPYSQHTVPLGPFANMIGYPFLPQSYTYMPSAFQQTFAGNSTYHQSLAAVLPQYKNSVSVSSLPQSAAVASAYGFGSSTSIPAGNFPLNPPTAPGGTTIGYDDVLSSQYKDGSHLISSQQNETSGMWVHGPGSRTMSAVPASTYYSFQGQNQQPGGFRQGQQLSQHFGTLGYPNYYHSQTGISLEHQQQNSRDSSLSGSQGQPSKQTQQLWQNSY